MVGKLKDERLFLKFKKIYEGETGHNLDLIDDKCIRIALSRRLEQLETSLKYYIERLHDPIFRQTELQILFSETINSNSYFFRDSAQYEFFEQIVTQDSKIASIGIANGEEPYSLAMILEEKRYSNTIDAYDMVKHNIENAKRGIFYLFEIKRSRIELEKFSKYEKYLNKYFREYDTGKVKIEDTLKSRIKFMELNIVKDPLPQTYDIIFCRNLLFYLMEEAKKKAETNLYEHLNVGGYLFSAIPDYPIRNGYQVIRYKDSIILQKVSD
jgi:chemotaxis protein methyltransferase CheR